MLTSSPSLNSGHPTMARRSADCRRATRPDRRPNLKFRNWLVGWAAWLGANKMSTLVICILIFILFMAAGFAGLFLQKEADGRPQDREVQGRRGQVSGSSRCCWRWSSVHDRRQFRILFDAEDQSAELPAQIPGSIRPLRNTDRRTSPCVTRSRRGSSKAMRPSGAAATLTLTR